MSASLRIIFYDKAGNEVLNEWAGTTGYSTPKDQALVTTAIFADGYDLTEVSKVKFSPSAGEKHDFTVEEVQSEIKKLPS